MLPPWPFSLSDKSDKPRNATVTQKFGSVICEEDEDSERKCHFGTVTTTVQVEVKLKITSITEM